MKISGLRTADVRFPTSQHLDGSDAMNPDPDYSAAYVILETDGGLEGHGLTFTIGRGNEICVAAIEALRPLVVGLDMEWVAADMGRFWRHSGVDSDIPVATASTDNIAAAALAADKMASLIGDAGKVAVVAHDQTSRTGVDRRDGFVNRMKEAHPNVEIVTIEYGGGDHLKSTEITKAILTANPDIKGIFGTNEGSAIGVVNGVKESGAKVVVVGYDSGKAQKDAIRDGTMAGAITQNPVGIGYETVKAAVAASKGEKVEKNIDTGFFWYDKTNIDAPEISAVLYD